MFQTEDSILKIRQELDDLWIFTDKRKFDNREKKQRKPAKLQAVKLETDVKDNFWKLRILENHFSVMEGSISRMGYTKRTF